MNGRRISRDGQSLCSGRTVKSRIEAEQNCPASQRSPHDRHYFFLSRKSAANTAQPARSTEQALSTSRLYPSFYFSCVEQIFYILYTSQKIIKIRLQHFVTQCHDTQHLYYRFEVCLRFIFSKKINLKHTKLIVDGGECHAANSGNKPGSIEKGHSQQLQQLNLFKKA